MTRLRCGSLPVSISAVSQCRTRPRFASSATCWSSTSLELRYLPPSTSIFESLGLKVGTGTIVDATIISAPSSTKNATKQCDPEMHQTRKGQQWYFGMKADVGVDSRTRLIHSAVATAANVHDASVLGDLLHGEERRVWATKPIVASVMSSASMLHLQRTSPTGDIVIAVLSIRQRKLALGRSRGTGEGRAQHRGDEARVGFVKVRYRGLDNNAHRLFVTCGPPIFTSLEGRSWLRERRAAFAALRRSGRPAEPARESLTGFRSHPHSPSSPRPLPGGADGGVDAEFP